MAIETRTRQEQEPSTSDDILVPPVDVFEDTNGITLYADLPGVPKDKLQLHIAADTLTIEGEMHLDLPALIQPSHIEVGAPRYRRTFTLSRELDTEKVQAEFNQGVLMLRIPKKGHAQARRIEVRID